MERYIWEKTLTDQHTMQTKKKNCQNNSALRKETESKPKCDCSVKETEAIIDSFLLAEGLLSPACEGTNKAD